MSFKKLTTVRNTSVLPLNQSVTGMEPSSLKSKTDAEFGQWIWNVLKFERHAFCDNLS